MSNVFWKVMLGALGCRIIIELALTGTLTVLFLLVLVALYGLAFDKAILSQKIWNTTFVGLLIISGVVALFSGLSLYNNVYIDAELYWRMFHLNVLIVMEYAVASYVLYVYSRRSDFIWLGK